MALKNILDQARQIRSSADFSDVDLGDDNADRKTVAEGKDYLEGDMNVIRSMILDMTGEDYWSDKPAVTLKDAAGSSNKLLLQPVQSVVTGVDGGDVVTDLDVTAGATNTTDTEDIGYIVDDSDPAVVDSKARITLRDKATNEILVNDDEHVIFGIGSNDGNDKLKITFYTDEDGTATAANVTGDVEMILPYRQTLADLDEQAMLINAGFAGAVGAFEIGDRVYTDVNDKDGNPIYDFVENEDLTATINKLAGVSGEDKNLGDNIASVSGITDKNYNTTFGTDGANYLADEDTLVAALTKLDTQIKSNEDAAAEAKGHELGEILTAAIAEGDAYTIPDSKDYDKDDKDAIMIFVNGQKLTSDLIIGDGSAGNGDFTPDSTTTVKFAMPLIVGDLVTSVIYKAAPAE